MRYLSANVKQLISRPDVAVIYLVKIVTNSTTLLETTWNSSITVPSLGTYLPSEGLYSIEPPRSSQSVDKETYKMGFVDPSLEKLALFDEGIIGARVLVHLCLLNTTDSVIGGAQPGFPLVGDDDLIVAYGGFVDTYSHNKDAIDGKSVAVIECASPMAALGLTRSLFTTRDSLRQLNPNDTAFDQSYIGSAKAAYDWGRA